jgi:hypothetical protein
LSGSQFPLLGKSPSPQTACRLRRASL